MKSGRPDIHERPRAARWFGITNWCRAATITAALSLSGCIYVPWFELKRDPSQVDFRPLVGPDKPIHPGVTLDHVIRLLGEPRFASGDAATIGYRLNTFNGFWFYLVPPIILNVADSGTNNYYAVVLQFDDADRLKRWEVRHTSITFPFLRELADAGYTIGLIDIPGYPSLIHMPAGQFDRQRDMMKSLPPDVRRKAAEPKW